MISKQRGKELGDKWQQSRSVIPVSEPVSARMMSGETGGFPTQLRSPTRDIHQPTLPMTGHTPLTYKTSAPSQPITTSFSPSVSPLGPGRAASSPRPGPLPSVPSTRPIQASSLPSGAGFSPRPYVLSSQAQPPSVGLPGASLLRGLSTPPKGVDQGAFANKIISAINKWGHKLGDQEDNSPRLSRGPTDIRYME